jgi:purine-cytosine permease-like protein
MSQEAVREQPEPVPGAKAQAGVAGVAAGERYDARHEAGEDHALRKVPGHWKRTPFSFAMSLSGLTCSMFFFALGGTVAIAYGFVTSMIALGITSLIGIAGCAVIARVTAVYGIDLDLLTRGSGFGFIGSSITSLIYALNWLMYAGIEAAFLASAVHAEWPSIPLRLLYVVASLVTIPINWWGFVQNDFVQRITWPIYIAGLAWLMIDTFNDHHIGSLSGPGVSIATLCGALGALLPNVVIQILGTGDFARFVRKTDVKRAMWMGPFMVILMVYLVAFPIGALLALATQETNPGIYAAGAIGVSGVVWIVVTQLRINNMNYYSGSLALANFSARTLRFVPGRRFWVGAVGVITIFTTQLGIQNHLVETLQVLGTFCLAWAGALAADIMIVKPRLGVEPTWVEHRRGYLKDWGVPSLIGLVSGSVVGSVLAIAKLPDANYGPLLGEALAVVLGFVAPLLAWRLRPKSLSLLARWPEEGWYDDLTLTDEQMEREANLLTCGVCGTHTMRQDMLTCPVVEGGVVCSVCCSAHSTCGDACKEPGAEIPVIAPVRAGD